MRARIAPDRPVDSPMLIVEAENDSEIWFLRCLVIAAEAKKGIQFGSWGGNASEGNFSLNIIPKYLPAAGTESPCCASGNCEHECQYPGTTVTKD